MKTTKAWDGTTAELTRSEQQYFAHMLRSLDESDWVSPSLCEGWSVKDVVVHTAAHIHNRQTDKALIRHYTDGPTTDLVSYFESAPHELPTSPRRERRLFAEVQRGELMVHQQDVRRALGISRDIPFDQVSAVLSFGLQPIGSLGLAFGRERVGRLRLVATDGNWSWGSGREVRGRAEALLMATAGRESAIEELDGPGVALLADHTRNPTQTLKDLIAFSAAATAPE
jgi:uncharacterized protein (TIGR03083 family)